MVRRERARIRCRERLEALTEAGLGADDARRAAIAELHRAVGFDRWCWPLTDPQTVVSTNGLGEIDFWSSLPRLVALEHGGDLTSKPRLLAGPPSVALSAATHGDLARSRRWRECLRPYGIGDELMTACHDRRGCWGTVELMRGADDAPFDDDDQRLLAQLAPTLGTLLRRGAAAAWSAPPAAGAPNRTGTLILDGELRTVGSTAPFRDWLEVAMPQDAPHLPPAVHEIAARALAPPSGLPDRVRIRDAAGRWSVLEGAALEAGGSADRVAITVRAATTAEVFDILCRAHDLTARERELVALILAGRATRELAQALCISPHTVQDHLKAVFVKTGVHSRRELVSRLAGR
jgi:DNA-binding CsgD family transcriptional regulator